MYRLKAIFFDKIWKKNVKHIFVLFFLCSATKSLNRRATNVVPPLWTPGLEQMVTLVILLVTPDAVYLLCYTIAATSKSSGLMAIISKAGGHIRGLLSSKSFLNVHLFKVQASKCNLFFLQKF